MAFGDFLSTPVSTGAPQGPTWGSLLQSVAGSGSSIPAPGLMMPSGQTSIAGVDAGALQSLQPTTPLMPTEQEKLNAQNGDSLGALISALLAIL